MFLQSKAANGGIYIAIEWDYKNVSAKPINVFGMPSIHLLAPDGMQYDADAGASASFATEVHTDQKILSDLNPGISDSDADVFEVSKETFDPSTWRIVIEADGEDTTVAFANSGVAAPVQGSARRPSTPPQLDPEHPLLIGGEWYPDASKRTNEEGRCVVQVTLAVDGRITAETLQQSSGFPRLDEACLKGVHGQCMLPETEDGKPVEKTVNIPIMWKLTGK
jgi:TonB family protein